MVNLNLSSLAMTMLRSLIVAIGLSAASSIARADVVVGFGDSITRGFPYRMVDLYGKREGGYIPKLENDLRWRDPDSNWEVHNWGFGQMNSLQATGQIDLALSSSRPSWVLVMIGTNDLFDGVPPASMRVNIAFLISRIRAYGATPALATILPSYFPGQGGEVIPTLLNPIVVEVAESTGVLLNDAYTVFLPRWPQLNIGDGLHPNIEGYELLATTWCDTIPICDGGIGTGAMPFIQPLLLD